MWLVCVSVLVHGTEGRGEGRSVVRQGVRTIELCNPVELRKHPATTVTVDFTLFVRSARRRHARRPTTITTAAHTPYRTYSSSAARSYCYYVWPRIRVIRTVRLERVVLLSQSPHVNIFTRRVPSERFSHRLIYSPVAAVVLCYAGSRETFSLATLLGATRGVRLTGCPTEI